MEGFPHPVLVIHYHRSLSMYDQVIQRLTNYTMDRLLEDPRDNELPLAPDDDPSQSLIIRTGNGRLDLRVRHGNLPPQLRDEAAMAVRTASDSHAFEVKSRGIRDIVVPALAAAALFALVVLRPLKALPIRSSMSCQMEKTTFVPAYRCGVTAAAELPTALPTLTIRNLTVTLLELKLVERLESHPHPHLHKAKGLVKVSSHVTSPEESHEPDAPLPSATTAQHEEPPPPSKQDIAGVTISPFSGCHTSVYAPDPTLHEQLRLTFEDPATGHLYSAEIPASSRRSIVLRALAQDTEAETKEFTAIYLPQHAHLALFSSANLSSWMSTLDGTLPLSALSIPGTHNSPTCHVALPSVRCQAVPVLDQLHNGVRFLDVRVSCPSYDNSTPAPPPSNGTTTTTTTTTTPTAPPTPELSLVHSAFPISLTGPKYLSTLLATLYAFLDAHPSETVLLSLKREGTGRGSDADLSQILHTHYITPHRARWYTAARVPTLAQARGRIVLVRRFRLAKAKRRGEEGEAWEGGIDGSVWPDNVADGTCGSGTIRIQDYYGIGSGAEIQRKVRFAQEGLERAAQGVVRSSGSGGGSGGPGPETPLFINFLSASNFFNASCWPDRIAVKINPSMIEYLCMGHGAPGKGPAELDIGDAATGIVVTDWVGHHGDWDLVRCIVGWNARLQLRQ
ncbi:PLC-like phosphodiesterase [Chaetomium fimeti]|uniref:PLC-like phosphodiesterase n=1 Tax=Chaetomium fimeti TaxID=1854472 RepID=A0AAE0LWC5_9PEZI|nr:PLC-like phosphodiesterase [Chaetomium fimeti]